MICAHCGTDFNATGLSGRRKYCITCSPIRSRNLEVEAERKRNAYQHVSYEPRTCQREGCQATFTPKQKHQRYCSPRCQETHNVWVYRRRNRDRDQATCKHCGSEFTRTPGNRQVYCSTECHHAYKAERYAILYRTRSADVRRPIPSRIRRYILERDGWRCHECCKRINRRLRHPHPDSASIDHLVPLATGGADELANLAAAHLHCNTDKGARVGRRDQLRLIG